MKPQQVNFISTRRGLAYCCLSVGLLWLALPGGGGLWPLVAIALIPFLLAVFRADGKGQLITFSLFFGVAHYLAQLYWIVFVLGHYGGISPYLSIPALIFLCFYLSCYFAAFSLLQGLFVRFFSFLSCLLLVPSVWVAMDYLRSLVFSGFPWMDLGYGLATVPLLMQSADLFGHHGLSFLIIMINVFCALPFVFREEKLRTPAVFLIFLLSGTLIYSFFKLRQMDDLLDSTETMTIGVVQANIDQGQKWNREKQGTTVSGYLAQSGLLMGEDLRPELLLWPETALPFYPPGHSLLAPISDFLRKEQVMLLTGAPWFEEQSLHTANPRLFNSSILFDVNGNIVQRTSKSHLVPFGEYVPFKRYLPFIAPLVEGVGDFIPGLITNPPSCKNAKIGVLICFESIFPDISRKWVGAGANLLVNITNDAWYGRSSAPYQTLAMTRMRAVETRRSIIRSANTGFSVFIDPLGRLEQLSPLFVRWQAGGKAFLMKENTIFVRYGFAFAPGCLIVVSVATVVCLFLARKKIKISGAKNVN